MLQQTLAKLNNLLTGIAAQFSVDHPPNERQRWEFPILIGLVAVGAWLRFWGLGSWGLEWDEKTMALPVIHIVQHGTPLFPTGMFYARAIAQLYMMAGSIEAFGQTEWAMRLPSVLCGLILIPICYRLGRRFLTPIWNMAFVAVAAFFPVFIADSQEARMYIFLVVCLAAYTALIFEWERSTRVLYLVAATIMMLIGVQFHELAIFGTFLFLFPGLVHADVRSLRDGGIAFAISVIGFALIYHWVEGFYPPQEVIPELHLTKPSHIIGATVVLLKRPWLYLAGAAGAILLSFYVARAAARRSTDVPTAILLFLSIAFQLAFFFHLGLLLGLAGIVVARRRDVRAGPLVIFVVASILLAAAQFASLQSSVPDTARRTIGAMVGLPSIWPYIKFSHLSGIALAVVGLGIVRALWLMSESRRIPDYWLFLLLTVLAPLWLIGVASWDVAERYTEVGLLPLLLCALAVCQAVVPLLRRQNRSLDTGVQAGLALGVCILIVNPLQLSRIVNAGYTIHPDHKGAAEFIQSIHPGKSDVIVAEDSLHQTYYLGHVDYWLLGLNIGKQFVRRIDGQLRDIYTGAPLIGTGAQLLALVNAPGRGTIYVIGSGELQEDGRRNMRSMGIYETLQMPIFEQVYLGRDGLTKVWRVRPTTDARNAPMQAE